VPGIPQVYYVGLLGGRNDMDLLERSGVGRDINRHYYNAEEVASSLQRPMVKRLLELIRLRNAHPAFNGECTVQSAAQSHLSITWKLDSYWINLNVDLARPRATIEYSIDQTGSGALVPFE
jgi:sucrose phosphorylase